MAFLTRSGAHIQMRKTSELQWYYGDGGGGLAMSEVLRHSCGLCYLDLKIQIPKYCSNLLRELSNLRSVDPQAMLATGNPSQTLSARLPRVNGERRPSP